MSEGMTEHWSAQKLNKSAPRYKRWDKKSRVSIDFKTFQWYGECLGWNLNLYSLHCQPAEHCNQSTTVPHVVLWKHDQFNECLARNCITLLLQNQTEGKTSVPKYLTPVLFLETEQAISALMHDFCLLSFVHCLFRHMVFCSLGWRLINSSNLNKSEFMLFHSNFNLGLKSLIFWVGRFGCRVQDTKFKNVSILVKKLWWNWIIHRHSLVGVS